MRSDTRPFGFVAVEDAAVNRLSIYMPITEANKWVKVGDEVGFDLIAGPHGPRAAKVARLEDDTAA